MAQDAVGGMVMDDARKLRGRRAALPSTIPLLDLTPEIDLLWSEIQSAIGEVIRSGQFVLGPQVRSFEDEVAEFLGVKHAVGCNSGTDALVIGLRALGIGPGDEVITTSFTFFATAEAISMVGAEPVFVDIDPRTFNLDPGKIEAALTPRTKAVIPVHLFGHAADLDPILQIARSRKLFVLEDGAQAFGGRYRGRMVGGLGHAGAFSFFPSKNLGAFGDGGLFVTNDDRLAAKARLLRTHGTERRYENQMLGYNSRLDEIQAAVLRVKLPYVERWNRKRQEAATTYRRLLEDLPGVITPLVEDYADHVFHQYTVRVTGRDRDGVQEALTSAGVGTMVYYPVPVHRLPVHSRDDLELPVTERAAREVLSLPMGPMISNNAIARVADALHCACSAQKGAAA